MVVDMSGHARMTSAPGTCSGSTSEDMTLESKPQMPNPDPRLYTPKTPILGMTTP